MLANFASWRLERSGREIHDGVPQPSSPIIGMESPLPLIFIPPRAHHSAYVPESLGQAEQNLIFQVSDIIDVKRLSELIGREQWTIDDI